MDYRPFTKDGFERTKNSLKSKNGKQSEVINDYVQNIMSLPAVHGSQPAKVHAFYEKPVSSVQYLHILGMLKYVRMAIGKLEKIRGDLVWTDTDWQEWNFPHLMKALRKWIEWISIKLSENVQENYTQACGKSFQARQKESKPLKGCVYWSIKNWLPIFPTWWTWPWMTKPELPMHLMLGTSEYTKIRV